MRCDNTLCQTEMREESYRLEHSPDPLKPSTRGQLGFIANFCSDECLRAFVVLNDVSRRQALTV